MRNSSRFMILACVVTGVLAATPAFAAKAQKAAPTKVKKVEPPPPPRPPPPPPAAERGNGSTTEGASTGEQRGNEGNRPAPYGTGYYSWSTRGGATLGQGNGARASLNFGTGGVAGYGYAGLEGAYIFRLGEDMDLGVGARVPFYPFGIAPGAQLRYRVMKAGAFQMAIDGSLYVPLTFFPYTLIGLSIEPGLMMSYFIKDNMEIYFGALIPVGIYFHPLIGVGVGFDIRGGFAYTLKKSNIGFFANIDFIPSYSTAGVLGASSLNASFSSGFGFQAGAQFRF